MSWKPGMCLDDVERETIIAAILYYDSKTKACAALKISYRKLTMCCARYRYEGKYPLVYRPRGPIKWQKSAS